VAAMRLADAAHQGIGAGDHNAAAHTEQEQKDTMLRNPRCSRQGEKYNGDEHQAQKKANLVALSVKQGAHADRGNDQSQRLGECNCAILSGVRRNRSERSGRMVASMRQSFHKQKFARMAAKINTRQASFQGGVQRTQPQFQRG